MDYVLSSPLQKYRPLILSALCLSIIIYFQQSYSWNFLETVGFSWTLFISIYFLSELSETLYNTWIGPYLEHNLDLRSQGEWGVVTGATDGIGKAYCVQLAQRGINVVLISRTESKLEKVAEELRSEYKVKTHCIAVDFTQGEEIYEKIRKTFETLKLQVGTLINNVGMSYPCLEYFLEVKGGAKFYQDMINCNVLSAVMMTYILLPQMVSRGKGAIVNIGSVTFITGIPFLSVYSSTKAFLSNFTSSLGLEYKKSGITFQYLCPSYVTTNLSGFKNSSKHIPTPEEFAEVAIKTIGLQKKTAGWILHRVIYWCMKWCHFVRPDYSQESCHDILRQVWLHGKKREMVKLRRQSKSMDDNNNVCSNGKANETGNGTSNGLHKVITNGISNGHSNGISNGYSNGTSNGQSNGISNGQSNGISNGQSNGISNGHSKGISNGLSNGASIGVNNGIINEWEFVTK